MANDIQSNMSTKQKATIAVLVVIILIVIWQVIGLFSDGSPSPASTVPKTNTNLANRNMQAKNPNTSPQNPRIISHQEKTSSEFSANNRINRQLIEQQKQKLPEYLNKLDNLRTLKIDREIAEINKNISSANLDKTKTDKEMAELLTEPTQPTGADFVRRLSPTAGATRINNQQQAAINAAKNIAPYVVVSIAMQLNKWMAVIGYRNKLYNVSIGDVLPPDNSMVIKIDKQGVTLKKDDKERKISIAPSI